MNKDLAMANRLQLRKLRGADCEIISDAFKEQGWNKPVSQYEEYLRYQEQGLRDIIVAELEHCFAGYLTIVWESDFHLFRRQSIPEIVDFNVLKKYHRQGIGTCLMDEAERRIAKVSNYAGLGVGVTKDYGAAQILYINRGYKPDGNGLVKGNRFLEYGEEVTVDDDLVLHLLKELQAYGT